jgi:hypothetical protein
MSEIKEMSVIKSVGESLQFLLQKNISDLAADDAIIFDSPADIDSGKATKLSIFLYQVVENSFLRNVQSEPVGLDHMRYPPLIIDLHFLFTPYANNRETEFIIFEKIMQILYDHPVLKGNMLHESLKGNGNDEIRVVPNNISFEEINKLWETFPNKAFKLSTSYILTPVRIPSEKPIAAIKRVLEKDIQMHRLGGEKDI